MQQAARRELGLDTGETFKSAARRQIFSELGVTLAASA